MSLFDLFPGLLQHQCFAEKPLVFIDVGASGALRTVWSPFAPYSICIAFEPDDRDFLLEQIDNSPWMQLHCVNRIVSDSDATSQFYLTSNPHCSSTLPPNTTSLAKWNFSDLFNVEQIVHLPATSISTVLSKLGIDYLDWFKTDSQGTDLRIWRNIKHEIRHLAFAAEFEPGILDAYQGEDKLHSVMAMMDEQGWWMAEMKVMGDIRISRETRAQAGLSDLSSIPISPGWAEVTYLRDLPIDGSCTIRDYLAAWMISVSLGQVGNALEIANTARNYGFDDPFTSIFDSTKKSIEKNSNKVSFRRHIKTLLSRTARAVFPRRVN